MGRGRQRAKQRKVARNLKYFSPETDYEALERELSSNAGADSGESSSEYDEYAELAAKYAIPEDEYDDADDDGSWAAPNAASASDSGADIEDAR